MPYYTYVLHSQQNDTLYYGQTSDIDKRIVRHNSGMVPYTRKYRPWRLVYFEEFGTRAEAMRREKFLKSGQGRVYIKTIIEK